MTGLAREYTHERDDRRNVVPQQVSEIVTSYRGPVPLDESNIGNRVSKGYAKIYK